MEDNMATEKTTSIITVTITPIPVNSPVGKLADAELHFHDGLLSGLKLIGFSVWERRQGDRTVTFPARQYSVNGERRSFALLRPVLNVEDQNRIRDLVLRAYRDHEKTAAG
jgi:hypothetical protein